MLYRAPADLMAWARLTTESDTLAAYRQVVLRLNEICGDEGNTLLRWT
jgi:hypothetical protein